MTFYHLPRPGTSQSKAGSAFLKASTAGVKHAVRQLCRTNFLVFQKVELGMEIGPHHKIWWEHLNSGEDVIELAPRDHGKSHSLIRAYALWKAKYDPWVQDILILGPDQPTAVENLDKMKILMNQNPSLWPLLPKGRSHGPDSRTEMQLGNNRVIKAKGFMSPLRGRHPQLILLDDVLNEKNSWSAEVRKLMKTRFNEVVVPMKDKGIARLRAQGFKSQIVTVGTAQDNDDMYHEMLSSGEYIGAKLAAFMDEEQTIPLWGERYSAEDLYALKRKVGSLSFSKEYMNKPLSDETTIFPASLFEPLFDRQISYARNYTGGNPVFLGVDFSVPGSNDGDWTVIVALEYDKDANLYTLLNYWRAKPALMQEQINQIEYYCQMYQVTMGFLEDNLFQGLYREHFKNRSRMPVKGHTVTGQNKRSLETGILSMRPMFENLRFRFPYATPADKVMTDYIVTEFNGIQQRHGRIGNETSHDDVVMAIWHAICASRATTFEFDFGG
jgi:hypothetical protein